MDRGACWSTVHGVTKAQTQLSVRTGTRRNTSPTVCPSIRCSSTVSLSRQMAPSSSVSQTTTQASFLTLSSLSAQIPQSATKPRDVSFKHTATVSMSITFVRGNSVSLGLGAFLAMLLPNTVVLLQPVLGRADCVTPLPKIF